MEPESLVPKPGMKERMKAGMKELRKVKKFRVKHVISKLREENWGLRRLVWLLLALALFYRGWTLLDIVKLLIYLVIFLFIALPFVFKYTPWIQRHLVFLPFVRLPGYVNFSDPESEGLPGSRNFYLESEPGVKLGVWQILPADIQGSNKDRSEEWFLSKLGDNRTVVLYLHGNSNNRAGPHRKELYNLLRNMNYHVITFDYRGYADSTQIAPNETAVVNDAKAVYEWIRGKVGTSRLIVWGHSLGTAVSSHLVSDLCLEGNRPDGLILESPFNNIFDEVRNHPMAWVWRKMPYFDWFFTSALEKNDLGFVSDQRISVVDIPILILHAKDDAVVPFLLGKALHEAALLTRNKEWPEAEFVEFEAEFGYGHKYICRDPGLPEIIRRFEARCA
ncbi:monoacylglycerol lipase ABHD12 [Eurytemora carolleeae]|uniref:monoacylglycerol lipase ABHD12 n=1 Tax=Eurytemora carolleeae TaxID=1294199 RepID=UPI000C78950F|nr:monoacylglycerol lipase ABHD12 [Eurytemora carolleeae]|eukprot:XP_023324769.1 monoacylglycerol lipase ABHD12-like [Eurytemora affinis]